MSAPSSPQAPPKQSPPNPGSLPATVHIEGRNLANGGRIALSAIPIPPSGRIQEAPLSPVTISVHPENWPPRASSAQIEEGGAGVRDSTVPDTFESELYAAFESKKPVVQGIPYRPDYNSGHASQIPQPQVATISSGESPGSRTPSDESSLRASRAHDRIDEEEDAQFADQPVPQLQYHHQSHSSETSSGFQTSGPSSRNSYPLQNESADLGASINRHLTPSSQIGRGMPAPRPHSAYSDMGPRGRSPLGNSQSPYMRAPSANSGRSFENRPVSYVDLNSVQYPQVPPAPISMDNSQLRSAVGSNASLLSMGKTLAMYRENVKKMNDVETQYAFATFLVQCVQNSGLAHEIEPNSRKTSPKVGRDLDSPYIDGPQPSSQELLREAKQILQKLSDRGYPFAQYYLADGYASGLFSKGKEDYGSAFPLFVSASKHGHAESGYRAALCYEFGWGCRKDLAKAVQFYRQSASKNHPGAMTRLGRACLSGDLGMSKYKEGLKWLNRATESADMQYNAAPYHLGLLYETGYGEDVFQDEVYAAKLFTTAADLGHPEASYRMGDAYEHGKLSCPRDPALSVHFYTTAAQLGHAPAMMALCAWYMVGAEPVLEKDENEAYEWALQAAQRGKSETSLASYLDHLLTTSTGLTKAEYAVGYFTEMGIGCRRDPMEANVWYVKAADAGDERATHRLAAIRAAASGGTPMEVAPPRNGTKSSKSGNDKLPNDKDCKMM
jgi:TPR repeat protein